MKDVRKDEMKVVWKVVQMDVQWAAEKVVSKADNWVGWKVEQME